MAQQLINDDNMPSPAANEEVNDNNVPPLAAEDIPPETTRSGRKPKYSARYLQYIKSLAAQAIFFSTVAKSKKNLKTIMPVPVEPASYQEAILCDDSQLWIEGIVDEFDSLIKNGTWEYVDLPPGRKAIEGKWVFKLKPGHKSTPPRYKARFVIKGFSQVFGVDYNETYAPVAKYHSLRVLLAIVAAKDLEMLQLDVKTAFLYGKLDEEIYMVQPEGFVVKGQESKVCRLLKSIYGLRQASRVWNIKFSEFLIRFGLVQSQSDPCLFIRHQRKGETEVFLAFLLYVDDGLVVSNSTAAMTEMVDFLSKEFDIKTLPADRFIGIDITRNRANRSLHLGQPDYCQKVIERFSMTDCKPLSVPADPCSHLSPEMCPSTTEEQQEMSRTPYLEAIGSLLHLSNLTRCDIAFAVGQASRYSNNPGKAHWRAVKRIIAYLKQTIHFGIEFGESDGECHQLFGYCDSDYAGDLQTRKSTSGFIFLLWGAPVSWASKRQACVALSTTEAEVIAVVEAAKEAIWLRRFIHELGFPKQTVPLLCDNQSAISLIRNPVLHSRVKHMSVRLSFTREAQENKVIDVNYICTEEQMADGFTKALPASRFQFLRESVSIREVSE